MNRVTCLPARIGRPPSDARRVRTVGSGGSRLAAILLLTSGLVLLATLRPSAAEQAPKTDFQYRRIECAEGYFRCEVPLGWELIREKREEDRTHYHGVYYFDPREEEIRPTLSVRYAAPDNIYFGSVEKYIDRQTKPGIVSLRDETTSPVRECLVDGRPARSFTRHTVEFYPPESLDTRKFPVRKEYVVIPHRTGFVVVLFSAQTAHFARWEPVFQHLLKTLELWPRNNVLRVEARLALESAAETESRVTDPIHAALARWPNASEIRSATRAGESRVSVSFQRGVSLEAEQTKVLERLKSRLPEQADVQCEPAPDPALMLIGLWSRDEERPRMQVTGELTTYARRVLLDRVRRIPGIAEVQLVAGMGATLDVVPDMNRLRSYDLDLREVRDVLVQFTREDHPGQTALDELRETVCAERNGKPVRLSDLAAIKVTSQVVTDNLLWFKDPQNGEIRHPPAVLLAVRSRMTADPAAVFRAVSRLLDELAPELPPGMHFDEHVRSASSLWIGWTTDGDGVTPDQRAARDEITLRFARHPEVRSIWNCEIFPESADRWSPPVAALCVGLATDHEVRLQAVLRDARAQFGNEPAVRRDSLPFVTGQFRALPGQTCVLLKGPDREQIASIAADLARHLRQLGDVANLHIAPATDDFETEFQVDEDRASRFDLKRDAIMDTLGLVRHQPPLGTIELADGRRVDLRVRAGGNNSDDPASWQNIPIRTPGGLLVRLGEVVRIERRGAPTVRLRVGDRPALLLTFDLPADRSKSFEHDWQQIVRSMMLPDGFEVTYEGAAGEDADSHRSGLR